MSEEPSGARAAERALRAAVERDPKDATAHSNLAVVLCILGEYAAALEEIRTAVELAPRMAPAYVNGAVIAGMAAGYEAALPWSATALELEPKNVAALLLHANALAKLDRGAEAIALCERALLLQPRSGEAYEMLAAALQAEGRAGSALAAFSKAQSLSTSGTIGVRKTMLLLELGRSDEALAEIERVLAAHPALAAAWYASALAKEFRLEPVEIEAMEQLLERAESLSFNDRVQLTFAIGRALLESGELDRGFARIEEGNRMKRGSIRYDAAADEAFMARAAQTFGPELFARFAGCGDPSELPVFVIGMPRSGTTLVEQILGAHPRVFAAGELRTLGDLAEPAERLTCEGLREAGRAYVARAAAIGGAATRVVDKMPLNFMHAGFIHAALPRARIVHCRRDALDTAFSCYTTLFDNHLGFSYDLEELGRFYRAYERLTAHWRAVLPPAQFIEVEYERLVGDLEGEARRLIAFCGLPWDAACLTFYRAPRPVRTASMTQVRRPIYATSVGRARALRAKLSTLGEGFQ